MTDLAAVPPGHLDAAKEAEIRATARRDFAREVRALLNFWEPAALAALTPEGRDVYDDEVEAMVSMVERAA